MPTNVIMPALELAQETGKVLRWLKAPGDRQAFWPKAQMTCGQILIRCA